MTTTPSGPELARRVIVLVFGLIQLVIALRIAFLLADARTGNDIVSATLNISQVFVAPFEGILKTDAIHAGGSILDAAAVVALIGWTNSRRDPPVGRGDLPPRANRRLTGGAGTAGARRGARPLATANRRTRHSPRMGYLRFRRSIRIAPPSQGI